MLMSACISGDLDMVRMLLPRPGLPINRKDQVTPSPSVLLFL